MRPKRDWTLWAGVVLGFSLLACAWTVMFVVAQRNPVATVPLASPRGGAGVR